MAGEVVTPIRDIPGSGTPSSAAMVALDNGVAMFPAELGSLADSVRPMASEAEAEAGTDAVKGMSPLTVKQSIASEVGDTIASASQGALAETAVQPDRLVDAGTGLTGGGDLSADRTISLSSSSVSSLGLADTAIQPGDLATVATTGSYNDLSDRPTIPPGTVTSVGLSVPAGLSVGGSPVTSSGTISLTYTSGFVGYTTAEASKLSAIQAGAQVNAVTSVAGRIGAVVLTTTDIGGLGTAATQPSSAFAPIAHVGAGGTAHPSATTSVAGFMSGVDKTKLDSIASGAQVNTVTSVAAKTGAVTLVKADVGLSNVDNTSDAGKPVSTATQTALNLKANAAVTITGSGGLTGGGDLTNSRVLSLSAGSAASLALADTAVQPTRTISSGTGLTGGGALSANQTIALNATSIASLAKADTAVQPAITITAGTGLTGGGTLAANRTVGLSAASIASLAKADSAVQLGANGSMPTGGATGQILAKASGTAYDVGWISSEAATAVSYGPQTLTGPQQTQALTNLGGTTVGRSLFTAASQAASRSASGSAPLPSGSFPMSVITASNSALVLPAGGTWTYQVFSFNGTGYVSFVAEGIEAGGAVVAGSVSGLQHVGLIWRIQ